MDNVGSIVQGRHRAPRPALGSLLMCGRATLTMPVEEIAEALGVSPVVVGSPVPGPPPRFNVAPTQSMLVLRTPKSEPAGRELAWARWGLVPPWAKDLKFGARCLQARSETVETTAAYREAFKQRRCVVLVDGFYEWSHPAEAKAAKVPHLLRPVGGGVLPIAGVWERWKGPEGDWVISCAVLTTAAGPKVATLHDRMPLVLAPHELETWLHGETAQASAIAHGAPLGPRDKDLVLTPVSTWVNDVRHDDAACVAPARA